MIITNPKNMLKEFKANKREMPKVKQSIEKKERKVQKWNIHSTRIKKEKVKEKIDLNFL